MGVDPNLDKQAQARILAVFLRTFLSVFIFNHGGREFSLARCGPGEGGMGRRGSRGSEGSSEVGIARSRGVIGCQG
jgi:hypothetical protein